MEGTGHDSAGAPPEAPSARRDGAEQVADLHDPGSEQEPRLLRASLAPPRSLARPNDGELNLRSQEGREIFNHDRIANLLK